MPRAPASARAATAPAVHTIAHAKSRNVSETRTSSAARPYKRSLGHNHTSPCSYPVSTEMVQGGIERLFTVETAASASEPVNHTYGPASEFRACCPATPCTEVMCHIGGGCMAMDAGTMWIGVTPACTASSNTRRYILYTPAQLGSRHCMLQIMFGRVGGVMSLITTIHPHLTMP